MKRMSSKDLVLLFIISIIIAIFASIQPIDNFIVNIIVFLIIFVSSGYSLMAVIYPEESCSGLLKKPFLGLELSVFLTVLISVVLKYSSLGLQFRDLILILSLITIVLPIAAYVLRINHVKDEREQPSEKPLSAQSKGPLSKNLITLIILSVLMIVTVIVPPINKTPLWMVPGSLFVCFIPGYLLTTVLFPRNDDLEMVERLALGFGGSLILTSIIVLAFNYTVWSIRLELILIVLAVFSLIFCFITYSRTNKIPLERRLHMPKLEKILRIFLIICIILTVITAAYTAIQPEKHSDNKTSFYIKDLDVRASDYTLNLTSGTENNLTMVVVNQEGSTVDYRLLVQVNGSILKESNITLKNNEKMESPLNFTAEVPGERKMEFNLYKLPDDTPYKKLDLWINVT